MVLLLCVLCAEGKESTLPTSLLSAFLTPISGCDSLGSVSLIS